MHCTVETKSKSVQCSVDLSNQSGAIMAWEGWIEGAGDMAQWSQAWQINLSASINKICVLLKVFNRVYSFKRFCVLFIMGAFPEIHGQIEWTFFIRSLSVVLYLYLLIFLIGGRPQSIVCFMWNVHTFFNFYLKFETNFPCVKISIFLGHISLQGYIYD